MNYSFTWTQPYHSWPVHSSTSTEMAVIEAIDRLVDSGLTHPVADAILKQIANNSKR